MPGNETVKFGGNTTCIEVRTDNDDILIFDAGTGIRVLGLELMKSDFGKAEGTAHIFFTHSHWDHIQGFPFFPPAYVAHQIEENGKVIKKGNTFHLYGASDVDHHLEATLRGQMDNVYFPVDLSYLSAKLNFNTIHNNQVKINGTTITTKKLIHPNGVLGYRIEDSKHSIAIATDCEHPSNGTIDQNLLELAQEVDLLIYDGQYTNEEYNPQKYGATGLGKEGFGHSTPEEGVRAAKTANAKRLIITHHDPLHDDKKLEQMEKEAKELFEPTQFAYEGLEIKL